MAKLGLLTHSHSSSFFLILSFPPFLFRFFPTYALSQCLSRLAAFKTQREYSGHLRSIQSPFPLSLSPFLCLTTEEMVPKNPACHLFRIRMGWSCEQAQTSFQGKAISVRHGWSCRKRRNWPFKGLFDGLNTSLSFLLRPLLISIPLASFFPVFFSFRLLLLLSLLFLLSSPPPHSLSPLLISPSWPRNPFPTVVLLLAPAYNRFLPRAHARPISASQVLCIVEFPPQ